MAVLGHGKCDLLKLHMVQSTFVRAALCANAPAKRFDVAQSCFERIQARYAPGAAFCAIGDGVEERSAAAALRWPFVRICLGPPSATSPAVAAASTAELHSQPLTALTADTLLRRALGEGGSALAVRNVRPRPAVPDVDRSVDAYVGCSTLTLL